MEISEYVEKIDGDRPERALAAIPNGDSLFVCFWIRSPKVYITREKKTMVRKQVGFR